MEPIYILVAAVVVLAIFFIVRARRPKPIDSPISAETLTSPIHEDRDEIAAVIAAVVLSMSSGSRYQLVVRDITYIGEAGSIWADAGRRALMEHK